MSKYVVHELIENANDIGPIFNEIDFTASSDQEAVDQYNALQLDKSFKGFLMREPEKLIEDNDNGHWEKSQNEN